MSNHLTQRSPTVESLRAILRNNLMRLCGEKARDFGQAVLEAENRKITLKLYEGHPISALTLAYQLLLRRVETSALLGGTNHSGELPLSASRTTLGEMKNG